jgi:hypothetical protein
MLPSDIVKGKDGPELIEIICNLVMRKPTPEQMLRENFPIHNEVVWEAEMHLLVKRNIGAQQEKQMELLVRAGFKPFIDKKGVCVFFASSYAPECDSYAYWNEIEAEYKPKVEKPKAEKKPEPEKKQKYQFWHDEYQK